MRLGSLASHIGVLDGGFEFFAVGKLSKIGPGIGSWGCMFENTEMLG